MNENPWYLLPDRAPYVLPSDDRCVRDFNKKVGPGSNRFLRIDKILPEPFVGAQDAPVVLLSNNPGFGEQATNKRVQEFMDRMRKNLLHECLKYPFVFLDPDLRGVGKWWERKLKYLLKRFGREVIARSVLNITYFPYPSRRFGHRKLRVPSQVYSFGLVRDAVNRKAIIVFMRREDMWKEAVPELKNYDRLFQVKNVQNPAISPRNCPEHEYERVIEAITEAERKKQES
jgi:hypothetical protein